MKPTNASKIEHLPVSPGADVLRPKFRKPGRQPQNVVAAPLPADPLPAVQVPRPRLQAVMMFIQGPDGRPRQVGTGLYQFPGRPREFFARPWCRGRQREKKLNASSQTAAMIELGKLLGKIEGFENGYAKDPFSRTEETSVTDILLLYKKAGCPGRKNTPRTGESLATEIARINNLMGWSGAKNAAQLYTHEENRKYHIWRTRQIVATGRGKGGDRQVDKEIVTLSNAFRFAARNSKRTGVLANPIAQDRERFRDSSQVTHCRDYMPRNADELNSLARFLFASRKSEVLGWQLLFQAMVGQRSHEILKLRMDAKMKDIPGFRDGKKMYLFRSQSSKGTYGHVDLYSDLKEVLEAHKLWHLKRYPAGSPWYFPSPVDPKSQVDTSSLSHALAKACVQVGQNHRTSHGMRAYRVNVLRSEGYTDAEIALLIGHKTGGKLIVEVYGEGLDYKIGYRPDDLTPAWTKWQQKTVEPGTPAQQVQLI
jgi:integrase